MESEIYAKWEVETPRGVLRISNNGNDRMGVKIKTPKIASLPTQPKKNPWIKN